MHSTTLPSLLYCRIKVDIGKYMRNSVCAKILIHFVVKENLILNYRKQMKASEENCKKIQIKMRKTCKRLSSSLFTEINQADEVRTCKGLSSSLLTAIAQALVVLLGQLGVGIFLTISKLNRFIQPVYWYNELTII